MASSPAYPQVPVADRDGWTLVEESVETLFQLPAAKVLGATRRYEDEHLRAAVRKATDGDLDREWRFCAATRLEFSPGLPPGTLPSMILPTVRTEARRTFKQRLADRGVESVERGRRERMRVRSGGRARLTRYDGVDPVTDDGVPVSGWVGVWNDGTDFFVVTGGYPDAVLATALDLEGDGPLSTPPAEFRDAFFELARQIA